jgi:ribosomal protein S18 acetylase RimI-like enzyme
MTFTLRPATPSDADWLFAVRRATMQHYVEEAFGYWDENAQRQRFDQAQDLANIQIIQVNRRDVGLLHLERHARDIFLANIQIDPAFQGRGLGTAVIQRLMDDARRSRLPIRLQVLKVNQAARRLYQTLGFTATDEAGFHTQMIWRPS